ncbi:hypothetical protein D3C73_1068150 [compost metagenome]
MHIVAGAVVVQPQEVVGAVKRRLGIRPANGIVTGQLTAEGGEFLAHQETGHRMDWMVVARFTAVVGGHHAEVEIDETVLFAATLDQGGDLFPDIPGRALQRLHRDFDRPSVLARETQRPWQRGLHDLADQFRRRFLEHVGDLHQPVARIDFRILLNVEGGVQAKGRLGHRSGAPVAWDHADILS